MSDPVIVVISEQVTPAIVRIGAAGIPGPIGPAGSGGGGAGNETVTGTNKDSVTLLKGQVVANHSSGNGFVRANATTGGLQAIGLVQADVSANGSATIQTTGTFQSDDWTNVVGATTLNAKAKYYLDTTAGKLTTTPPTVAGNVVQRVGYAVALDTLMIEPLYAVTL